MSHFVRAGAAIVLAASMSVGSASAADDPTAAIRGDVDALVKMIDDRWSGRDDDGPSPTARVNRLIAAGDAKLKPVLAEAWKAVTTWTAAERYKSPTRQLARFLYSLSAPGKAAAAGDEEIVEEDGVVRIRNGDPAGGFGWRGWEGGGYGRKTDDSSPSFADLLKGGKLRKQAKPDVKKALAALDGGKIPETERFAVAKCVGECCATNKTALQDLLRRFDSDPASEWLMTALAWSGTADAERPLLIEIEALAERAGQGKEAAAAVLSSACRTLLRLRRQAVVDEVGKLAGASREAVLVAAGLDFATALDLAALEKSPDAAAKNAALAAICMRLVDTRGDSRASSATLTSLAKLLASNLDGADASLRASILAAAETLFYAYNRTPVDNSSSGIGDEHGSAKITGERVGPYPDMATLLASMGVDLQKGDLLFVDPAETSIFELSGGQEQRARWATLSSDVKCPDPTMSGGGDSERFPAKLAGVFTADGLRLTLTNVGDAAFVVDPVALRYGTAEITKCEFTGGKSGALSYRQLKLTLGFIRAGVATPAERLVPLAPKMDYTWTVKVRPEHRDVDHVCVECMDGFAVRGKPLATPLPAFSEAWVK